ncbi:MAG: DUF362 domain-containing protein [Myxococcota bacterium]|nr:DUF362 domain-containing protein [Myxococcota bacterium]
MIALTPFTDPRGSLKQLLDDLDLGLQPASRVIIKPDWNAVDPAPAETTSRAFLHALLSWLQEQGIRSVCLAHSALLTPPDVPYTSFMDLLEGTGCMELLEDFPHLRLVDLEVEPMSLRGGFLVPSVLSEQDLLINCVRLKTHSGTRMAVGTKGLMGLLPDSESLRMHREGLEPLMGQLGATLQPGLTLVEAELAMEGEGPHHGDPVQTGYYLGGTDLLEVDAAAAWLMGLEPAQVEHIAALAKALDRELPAPPQQWADQRRDFKQPTGVLHPTRAARVFPGDSCATCHVAAESVLDFAREQPTRLRTMATLAKRLFVDGVDLYMGHQPETRTPEPERPAVALGDCSACFAKEHGVPHIGGCPVRREQVQSELVALIQEVGA